MKERKSPVQLKIVPDGEPNAIGEWISVPEEIPVPYEGDGWKNMIQAYSKFIPEGYHIVMFKHSKVDFLESRNVEDSIVPVWPSLLPNRCRCDSPVVKCDHTGCHCTMCGGLA